MDRNLGDLDQSLVPRCLPLEMTPTAQALYCPKAMRAAPRGFIGFMVQNVPGSVVPSQSLTTGVPEIVDRKGHSQIVKDVGLVQVHRAVRIDPFQIDDVDRTRVPADPIAVAVHVSDDLVEPVAARLDLGQHNGRANERPRDVPGKSHASERPLIPQNSSRPQFETGPQLPSAGGSR